MPVFNLTGGPFNGTTHQLTTRPNELLYWLKEDGSLFDEEGKVARVAVYKPVYDKDEFAFERFDASEYTLSAVEAELERDPRGDIARKLYAKPNYEVYTVRPTDEHKQVKISLGHFSAEVDEGIAPLVLEVWKRGWDTMGSCQERPKDSKGAGMAYLDFPNPVHARAFLAAMKEAGIETKDGVNELSIGNKRKDGYIRTVVMGKMIVLLPTADIEMAAAFLRE